MFGYIQFLTHICREILDSYMHRVSLLTYLAAYSFFAHVFGCIEFLYSYILLHRVSLLIYAGSFFTKICVETLDSYFGNIDFFESYMPRGYIFIHA